MKAFNLSSIKVAAITLCPCFCATLVQAGGPYTDNGDTVIENTTGLEWQKQTADILNIGSIDAYDKVTWDDAAVWCENSQLGGYSDWRLPELDELKSLLAPSRPDDPYIDPIFQSQSGSYWSATKPDPDYTGSRYAVNFGCTDGCMYLGPYPKNNPLWKLYVRCVRNSEPTSFDLGVSVVGNGDGIVNINPPDSDCTNNCSKNYPAGSTVVLTASPVQNSTFAGWAGDCFGTSESCTVTMDKARSAQATFTTEIPEQYVLTLTKYGNGSGSVNSNIGGIECDTSCTKDTGNYNVNSQIILTANADISNSYFAGWLGACQGSSKQCTVTMDDSKRVTAAFMQTQDVAVDVFSENDCLTNSGSGNIFSVRVQNLGVQSIENVTVDITYTADESDVESWNWSCGDVPDGMSCKKNQIGNNSVEFTLVMQGLASIDLKGKFTATNNSFNAMTVAANSNYPDYNQDNNQDALTLRIDPAYLPKPENLTSLRGEITLEAANKNTLVFTHGWQSDDPAGCDNYGTSPEERKKQLECFAKSNEIWTGLPSEGVLEMGLAGQLTERSKNGNAINVISSPINNWQYVWEGAYTKSGMDPKGYIAARRNVYGAGIDLGKKLIAALGENYSGKIHLIGHSLGTAVNAYAVNYFIEKDPHATVQMTILDYPNRVDRIGTGIKLMNWKLCLLFPSICVTQIRKNEMSPDEEKKWGFDENFFSNVIKEINEPVWQYRLYVDNYFSASSSLSMLDTKINTAGVGTKVTGLNVYNHPALKDPNDIGGEFFPEENTALFFNNDHSGVHQWYRWTMWPVKSEQLSGYDFICSNRKPTTDDWYKLSWEPNLDQSLDPCSSGFAFSIVQDNPMPFPEWHRKSSFSSISPAADFDLVGGYTGNYCQLQESPLQVTCSKEYPIIQKNCNTEKNNISVQSMVPSDAPYFKSNVNLDKNVNYMSFKYKISNSAGTEFAHILIDGQIVWSMTMDNTEADDWIDSGKIPLFFRRGEHELMIVFNGMETDSSTFEMKELTFYQDLSGKSILPAVYKLLLGN